MSETVVIIRPSFKKICGDNDACRAAIFNQMLYNIAWKVKQGADYWYGTGKDIWLAIDRSWGLSKVIQEINALVKRGLLGQQYNPQRGGDRTYQYFFGPKQAQNLRTYAREQDITLEGLGLPIDVLHLLELTNGNVETNNSICANQQMETLKPTNGTIKSNNPFVESTKTLPKGPTKDTSKIPSKEPTKDGKRRERNTGPLPKIDPPSLPSSKEHEKFFMMEDITHDTPLCWEAFYAIGAHYLGAAKVTRQDAEVLVEKYQTVAGLITPFEVYRGFVTNLTFMCFSDHASNWFRGDKRRSLTLRSVATYSADYQRKAQDADWHVPPDKAPSWFFAPEPESPVTSTDEYGGMERGDAEALMSLILAESPQMQTSYGELPGNRFTVGLWVDSYWVDIYCHDDWVDWSARFLAPEPERETAGVA